MKTTKQQKETANWIAAVVVGFIAVFFTFILITMSLISIIYSAMHNSMTIIMFMPFFGSVCSFVASGRFLLDRLSEMMYVR